MRYNRRSMSYDEDRAVQLLRLGTSQPDAAFRRGQEQAVRHVVEGRGRLLVVQRTGWGKSFVYFIGVKLLREAGMGPALLVSPLPALMRNQIAAAERMGVQAATINSDNKEVWERVEGAVLRDEVDILLISPERLGNQRFVERVLAAVGDRISLLVIDEAHCISDWGHDFRPDYRRIGRIVEALPPNLRLLATTATANDRVVQDLQAVLGPSLAISRGSLDRPSLALRTIRLRSQAERLAWLAEQVPAMPGSGIIYTLTVRDAEQVADWLRRRDLLVEAYTGESGDCRPALEQALLDNEVKALVATTALGMGFDKPDLAFVIHYQAPGSVVAYYQQVGRAGRALESAHGVLLGGEEDTDITDFFINTAFPERWRVDEVIAALEAEPDGLTEAQILAQVNVRQGRLKQLLKILSLEAPAPVVKEGSRWQLTAAELSEEFWQRVERLTALRRQEQEQMQEYVDLDSGHMEFLIRALDGDPGDATAITRVVLPVEPSRSAVLDAVAFLKGAFREIAPRKRGPRKMIPLKNRAETGRALCHWKDAGWGRLVPMENSAQQAADVWGSLEVDGRPPAEPVLLVDDIVDSRWTFTVAAWVLRNEGSGEVWPLALAQA